MDIRSISEAQRKRAINIIWNSAGNYHFTPDFRAYDDEGKADLYFNSIIGAVFRHYDYPRIQALFRGILKYEDRDIYESLLWLALENAVYPREVSRRPVLRQLRRDYAFRWVRRASPAQGVRLYDLIALAHFRKILGQDPGLDPYNAQLLSDLEFDSELDTDQIVEKAEALLMKWFQINTRESRSRSFWGLRRNGGGARRKKPLFRPFGGGFADHPDLLYGGENASESDRRAYTPSRLSAEELREFIRFKFGKPLLAPAAEKELEKQLCTGNHALCHLHITRGESYSGSVQNAFEALQKQKEDRQRLKNREYYAAHASANRTAVSRLTAMISNSVLLYLQSDPIRGHTGLLDAGRAWRAATLEDDAVFQHSERDAAGDISVDILLDASTSQKSRQEIIASQGYIIAESLNRCSIPCRVASFCSMTGYTILHVFRDYRETSLNDHIFDYVSNGCNRDGLAVRIMHDRILQSPCEHRILIILSDVKPNDVSRIPKPGEGTFLDYNGDPGIADTATEVRRARADDISVICVFTGEEEDIPSARMVYGSDFARIQSLDMFASTVGKLILGCIRNM